MSMLPLLGAASAGVAHIFLGADRLFILFAIGSLRRCGSDSFKTSFCWSLGHLVAFLIVSSHVLPWWRDAIECNMYISGIMLVLFGLHVTFWQHMYADTDCFQHIWEVDWAQMNELEEAELASPSSKRPWLFEGCLRLPKLACCSVQFPLQVAAFLGFAQGIISPDFAFASGAAWSAQTLVPTTVLYAVFCMSFACCACMVSLGCWNMMSSTARSARGHRSARRSIGLGLCGAGFLWLFLVIQLEMQISTASHEGAASGPSSAQLWPSLGGHPAVTQCPLMISIGNVSFASAPTWEMVAKLDPWWTTELLERYRRPPFRFSIGPSKIGGCGVIAHEDVPAGSHVGLAGILTGPWDYSAALVHVTPWLGIAINHCQHSNAKLHRNGALLMLETTKTVTKGQEITFDYDIASDSIPIERAQPHWTC